MMHDHGWRPIAKNVTWATQVAKNVLITQTNLVWIPKKVLSMIIYMWTWTLTSFWNDNYFFTCISRVKLFFKLFKLNHLLKNHVNTVSVIQWIFVTTISDTSCFIVKLSNVCRNTTKKTNHYGNQRTSTMRIIAYGHVCCTMRRYSYNF